MSQYRQKTKTVVVPDTNGVVRVWDDIAFTPLKNLVIYISGAFDATLVTAEVFMGGEFLNAAGNRIKPYSRDAVDINGGITQVASAPVGADTTIAAFFIEFPTKIFPANDPDKYLSAPLYVELSNTALVDATVNVTFMAETLGTTV
jgi:hypothetical protein